MTKVGIFASIGLIALVISCAGGKKAPRGKGTGKKPPAARTTRPVTAPSPRTRPTTAPAATRPATAPSPATTRAAAERERARIYETHTLMAMMVMAVDMFEMDTGRHPTGEEGLEALVTKPAFDDEAVAESWRGPYLKKLPLDPWGRPIHYELAKDRKARTPYRIWSAGPDRQSGTEDDIRNWRDE